MSAINKFFRIGLVLIIIGIILKQFFDTKENISNLKIIPFVKTNVENNISNAQELQQQIAPVSIKANMPILKEADNMQDLGNDKKLWSFSSPNPWVSISFDPREEYPWGFYLKTKVPSLNSYEAWKNIIPNISLTKNGLIIIPSKDEASALAIANLIVINFSGDMSLEDILKKNLIQISVGKAKAHTVVQNKLREQLKSSKKLVENMCNINKLSNREQMQNFTSEQPKTNVDFTASGFSDTFQHFNEEKTNIDGIQAFENNDLVKF
jgi:hypothetical protein